MYGVERNDVAMLESGEQEVFSARLWRELQHNCSRERHDCVARKTRPFAPRPSSVSSLKSPSSSPDEGNRCEFDGRRAHADSAREFRPVDASQENDQRVCGVKSPIRVLPEVRVLRRSVRTLRWGGARVRGGCRDTPRRRLLPRSASGRPFHRRVGRRARAGTRWRANSPRSDLWLGWSCVGVVFGIDRDRLSTHGQFAEQSSEDAANATLVQASAGCDFRQRQPITTQQQNVAVFDRTQFE